MVRRESSKFAKWSGNMTIKKTNILLVPCDTEIAYEIAHSLTNHKYFKLIFAGHDKDKKYIYDHAYILPYEFEENFYEQLNALIEKENIEFIFPANDDIAYALSKNADYVRARIVTHHHKVHEICRYKDKTYEFFKGLIPVPQVFNDLKEIKESSFPIFVKPKKGQGSFNAYRIDNLSDLMTFFNFNNPQDYVISEYLPNEEYTIDCFAHNGKLLYQLVRKREKIFRGISIISTTISDDNICKILREYSQTIADKLSMHGIFFYQVKLNKQNVPVLLEIGPRVPGTLALNRALGVNLVEIAMYQALGLINEHSRILTNSIKEQITIFRPLGRYARFSKTQLFDLFDNLYVDFDDTLLVDKQFINIDVIKFIFYCKNKGKKIILITKNDDGSLLKILNSYGIYNVFDEIIHISKQDKKINYMNRNRSLLIDDSFKEREEAINNGMLAYSAECIKIFLDEF